MTSNQLSVKSNLIKVILRFEKRRQTCIQIKSFLHGVASFIFINDKKKLSQIFPLPLDLEFNIEKYYKMAW